MARYDFLAASDPAAQTPPPAAPLAPPAPNAPGAATQTPPRGRYDFLGASGVAEPSAPMPPQPPTPPAPAGQTDGFLETVLRNVRAPGSPAPILPPAMFETEEGREALNTLGASVLPRTRPEDLPSRIPSMPRLSEELRTAEATVRNVPADAYGLVAGIASTLMRAGVVVPATVVDAVARPEKYLNWNATTQEGELREQQERALKDLEGLIRGTAEPPLEFVYDLAWKAFPALRPYIEKVYEPGTWERKFIEAPIGQTLGTVAPVAGFKAARAKANAPLPTRGPRWNIPEEPPTGIDPDRPMRTDVFNLPERMPQPGEMPPSRTLPPQGGTYTPDPALPPGVTERRAVPGPRVNLDELIKKAETATDPKEKRAAFEKARFEFWEAIKRQSGEPATAADISPAGGDFKVARAYIANPRMETFWDRIDALERGFHKGERMPKNPPGERGGSTAVTAPASPVSTPKPAPVLKRGGAPEYDPDGNLKHDPTTVETAEDIRAYFVQKHGPRVFLRMKGEKHYRTKVIQQLADEPEFAARFGDDSQAAFDYVDQLLHNDTGLERVLEAPDVNQNRMERTIAREGERHLERQRLAWKKSTLDDARILREKMAARGEAPASLGELRAVVETARGKGEETIASYELEPGERLYVPKDKDVYDVSVDAEGRTVLQDGKTIVMGDEQTVDAVRLRRPDDAPPAVEPAPAPEPAGPKPLPVEPKPKPAEPPTMEEARRASDDMAAQLEQEKKAEALRKKDQRIGQGSLLDDELNQRIADDAERVREELDFEKKQKPLGGEFISDETMEAARKRLRGKLSGPKAGIDPTAIPDLVILAAGKAERLARAAGRVGVEFSEWAREMLADAISSGYMLTKETLQRLWEHPSVFEARYRTQSFRGPMPRAQGRQRVFMRETRRGELAFDETRRTENRIKLMVRMVDQETKRIAKQLGTDAVAALDSAARGIPRIDSGGRPVYGAIARAGTLRAYKRGERVLPPAGTALPDGRFVGPDLPDGKNAQLYRVIWPEEAEAAHVYLKQNHPEAAVVLDRFLANSEPTVLTAGGDVMPSMSRKALKEQYGIEGLTDLEAADAAMLARRAFGPQASGRVVPNEFSWVPESGYYSGNIMGRLRNQLRATRSSARSYKGGTVAERIRSGELEADFVRALGETRKSLGREIMHNELAPRLLALVAEPIKRGETEASLAQQGYRVFSRTGLWGETARVRRFMNRHRAWFEEQGINVPDTNEALYLAGGKGYKIPSIIADALAPDTMFDSKSVDPRRRAFVEAIDNLSANVVSSITGWWLTRPSSAVRNQISNTIVYSAKVMRDFYEASITSAGDLAHLDFDPGVWSPFVSDVKALGTAMTKKVRHRLPPELMGATFADAMNVQGPARLANKMLRLTGFNLADIYTKRVIVEAVIDASAKQAWYAAKKNGATNGRTRSQFIADYKANVPKSIESLAYREMDTWGGYDYSNVHPALEAVKKKAIGRAILPYPTYYYKLFNTYRELYGARNFKTLADKTSTKKAKIRAVSNIMAGTTMAAIAWKLAEQADELPQGVRDIDLPYDVQKYGRLKVPFSPTDREGAWVRLADMPFIGEAMAARGIWKDELTFGDYLNSRMALGPLFNIVAITAGLSNKFNKDVPLGSRYARELTAWLPFQAELETIRRLKDPYKRVEGEESWSGWRNFLGSVMNQYPFLSERLPLKTRYGSLNVGTYHPMEVMLSYAFLNTHFINEDEREAAIRVARITRMQAGLEEINRDLLREDVAAVMRADGTTLAGDIKLAAKLDEAEVELETEKVFWKIQVARAFQAEGAEAAWKKLESLVSKSESPYSSEAQKAATKWIETQEKRAGAGLAVLEFDRAPDSVQEKYLPEVTKEALRWREAK